MSLKISNARYWLLCLLVVLSLSNCNKIVQVPAPTQSITTDQAFSDSANSTAALAGIYTNMNSSSGFPGLTDGIISIYCGASADELIPFFSQGDRVYTNTLLADNVFGNFIWNPAYSFIYQANSIIEGVSKSNNITLSAKASLLGEAKFFRALFYFYLVNLYGDVPLITSTDYKANSLIPRISSSTIYQQINDDLLDASNSLGTDYSMSNGEKVRANKWAAVALLSRVYLYEKKYDSAEIEASILISNSGTFQLVDSLNDVFLKNSPEAILQWQINSGLPTTDFNATTEGAFLVNPTPSFPRYYLSPELLAAFEPGDRRRANWVDSTLYDNGDSVTTYYFPYKYKVGLDESFPNAPVTEYYMVLRLAEQYLIRSEARAQNNELLGAIDDLNTIRRRAGLLELSNSLPKVEVLTAVYKERRIELFAEWGHRWLDLKRIGQASTVLKVIPYKNQWQDYQQLYGISSYELKTNPNLKQNPGY